MILLVANSSWNLYHYRQPLILALLEQGFSVETAAPRDGFLPALQALTGGPHHLLEKLNPQGQNQLAELACLREISALYKRLQPQLILHFTIKPNIYGGLAARRLGLPYLAVITGLGYTFLHDSWPNRLVPYLYRLGLAKAKQVVFYNASDRQEFIQRHIVSPTNSCIIDGSGIDLEYFQPSPLPESPRLRCLYVGRLLKDKGLRELVKAVQQLQSKGTNIQLTLLGSPEVLNPEAIGAEELLGSPQRPQTRAEQEQSLKEACSDESNTAPAFGQPTNKPPQASKKNASNLLDPKQTTALAVEDFATIHFAAAVEDVRPYFASHHLFVLPSYREGLSRAGAEALACGRPILVSDVPGCRELLHPEVRNGYLVPSRSVADLEAALLHYSDLPRSTLSKMGAASRAWAEEKFDASSVSAAFIQLIRKSIES